jgi:hypothetical protein
MHPPASVRILSVSDHEGVRISRELLLQSVGYVVLSMSSDHVLSAEMPHDLAVAIIGQTTDDLSAGRIAAKLRRTQPNIRILRLTMQYSRCGPEFDFCCYVEDGPGAFLSCVAEMVATEAIDIVDIYSGSDVALAFSS